MDIPAPKKEMPLRILHLPVIILNQGALYVQALRALGHKCDYLLYDISQQDADLHDGWDINLGLTEKGYWARMRTIACFIRESLDHYDIYHFHSGRTFIPLLAFSRWSPVPRWLGRYLQFLDFMDLPYLKKKGKKLVFQFWGCDLRDPEFDLRHRESACLVCPPQIVAAQCNRNLKQKTDRITLKYGDARLSSGDLNVRFPDFHWVENAIDTTYWRPLLDSEIPPDFRWKSNGAIKIYHSFSKADSRNDVKGTRDIVEAVKNLQGEGHEVELMFFDKVPHGVIRYYQAQADIVVDQLKCGHYGNTAVECLSMGKPVITHLRHDVERLMPKDHPLIKADTTNIKTVLRDLVTDVNLRTALGRKSRDYAVRHHDIQVVGKRLEEIYYSIL